MAKFAVRQSLTAIEEYDVESVEAVIRVNANESNYPLPPVVAQALRDRLAAFSFNRYPPIKAETLTQLIASELAVPEDAVLIGNGSSELLERVCYVFGGSGKKIAVPAPSFSMYGEYAALADSTALSYLLSAEGFIDAAKLIDLCQQENPALLIICNPNNPTGNYNSLATIEKIIANVNCPVVLDEAYMEFTTARAQVQSSLQAACSALSLLGKYENLLVFRTFSKAYGLAGLRCGYAVGASSLMRALSKGFLPYHVNAYTLAVAQVVFANRHCYAENIATVCAERDKLVAGLQKLDFTVWPTATNFVCCRAEDAIAEKLATAYKEKYGCGLAEQQLAAAGSFLFHALAEQGILVRNFSENPLLPGCLRISIGLPAENKVVLECIRKIITEVRL